MCTQQDDIVYCLTRAGDKQEISKVHFEYSHAICEYKNAVSCVSLCHYCVGVLRISSSSSIMSFFIIPIVLRWFGFGSFLFLTLYEMDQQLFHNATDGRAYQPDLKGKGVHFYTDYITFDLVQLNVKYLVWFC